MVAGQTSATTANGTAGGNSTITGFETSILAAGGSGGAANNAGGTPLGGIGGTAAASAGTVKFAGGNGGNGNSWNLLGLLLSSGAGGAGAGSGGLGGTAVSGLLLSNAPGNAGSPPGGAGSGAINSALGASQIGGAGAAGRVIISYSCANFSITSTTATDICASAGTTSSITITGSAASLPVGNYVVTYDRSSPGATSLTANLTVSTAGTGTFIATGLTTVGSGTITVTKLTSESCSSTITANNTATVTVSAATVGGTVNGGTTINSGSTSGLLTLSGHTGSVIKWQSAVSPFSTWTDITNTTATYTSGPLTQTTQFRAVVQSGFCAAVNSDATTVTVNPRPTIVLASSAIGACLDIGNLPFNTTLSYYGTTQSPITYSIVWNSSPSNSFVTVTDAILPASPITIAIPGGTTPGNYVGTLTVKNANGAVSAGSIFTLALLGAPSISTTGTIVSVDTSASTQNATLAYSATTCNPTGFSINWDSAANAASLTDQSSTPFTFSSGGGSINTIVVAANVPAGTYYGILEIFNENCNKTQPITITINALPTITLAASATSVCSSAAAQSTDLSYSAVTGSPTTYSIAWDASPVNSFVDVTDAALQAGSIEIAIPAGTTAETYTGTLTVKNANGSVSNPGSVFTVTVNPSPTISSLFISGSTCSVANEATPTSLVYSSVTGSPVTYSIVWDPSPANNFADATDAPLMPGQIGFEIPAGTVAGTYSGTLFVKNADGCVSTGSVFFIEVGETPTITTTGTINSVNTSAGNQNATLTYTATTSGPSNYSIDWDSVANAALLVDQDDTSFAFMPGGGTIDNIVIPANVPAGTYTGTIYIDNESCVYDQQISITINASPTIVLASSTADVCSNNFASQNTTLSYTATTGNPVTYNLFWDENPVNSFPTLIDANLTASPITILIPVATAAGTYTGTLTVKDANGAVSVGSVFTLTVNATPTITTNGTIDSVFTSSSSQDASLSYSQVSENPTSYYIDWNAPANTALLTDQASTPFAFVSSGGVINTIQIPANVPSGSYSGKIYISNGNCTLERVIDIDINEPAPTIQIAPSAKLVCSNTNAQTTKLEVGAISGSPTTYSIVWNSSPANSFVDVTDNTLVYNTSFIIAVPAGTIAGTYTGTLTVKNANGVESSGNVFTVTVNETPTVNVLEPIATVTTSENAQNSSLVYSSSAGDATEYYIDWSDDANNALLLDQPVTPYVFEYAGGFLDTIEISANAQPGSYQGTLYFNAGSCTGSYPVAITINNPASPPTLQIGFTRDVCSGKKGAQTTLLEQGESTGSPITYSIVWDSSPTNSFVPVIDEPIVFNAPFIINVPAGTSPGNYTGTMTVKNANGISSVGTTFDINVIATPSVSTSATVDSLFASSSSQNASLSYFGTEGNPSSYSIDWDDDANNALLTDQGTLAFSFDENGGAIDTIEIPANLPPGTYYGTISISNGTCAVIQSISITIDPVLERSASKNTTSGTTDLESAEKATTVTAFNQVINVETTNQTINQVFVFDVAGNLLYRKDGVSDSKLIINSLRSSNQVLVVKVVLNDNRIATKKVIY